MLSSTSPGSTIWSRPTDGRSRKLIGTGRPPNASFGPGPNTSGPTLITWPRKTLRSLASVWISPRMAWIRSCSAPVIWSTTSGFGPRDTGCSTMASRAPASSTR